MANTSNRPKRHTVFSAKGAHHFKQVNWNTLGIIVVTLITVPLIAWMLTKYHERIELLEAVVAHHHGADWRERIGSRAIESVDHLLTTINNATGCAQSDRNNLEVKLKEIDLLLQTVQKWARQGDDYMITAIKDSFTCKASFSRDGTEENLVLINLAHDKAHLYNRGDYILICNRESGNEETIAARIAGVYNNPDCNDVLVQLNMHALRQLAFDESLGFFRVAVQPKELRSSWITLDQMLKEKNP